MKRLIVILFLYPVICFVSSCGKESDEPAVQNQWKASFNGKDSTYTITKATLQNFSDHQQLSIITALSGTCFDMYVNAPTITAKEYPIHSPFSYPYPSEYGCCYYRILQPNSVYTARAYVSTESGPDYKVVITELNGKTVKGTIKYKGNDPGLFTSGEMVISATFSTNLLEIIN